MHLDLQPGNDAFWKGTATLEGTISGLLSCNFCTWLWLRPALPDWDERMTSEVNSWLKVPDEACMPVTVTVAHTFPIWTKCISFLGLIICKFQKKKKINPVAGFLANYLCPVLPGCLGGFLFSKAIIGWQLEILFKKKEVLAPCKLILLPLSLSETVLHSQLMMHVISSTNTNI